MFDRRVTETGGRSLTEIFLKKSGTIGPPSLRLVTKWPRPSLGHPVTAKSVAGTNPRDTIEI